MPIIKLLKTGKSYKVIEFDTNYISLSERDNFIWIPEIEAVCVDGVITVNDIQVTSTYNATETLQLINSDKNMIEYNGMTYDMDYSPQRAMLYDALKTEMSIEEL